MTATLPQGTRYSPEAEEAVIGIALIEPRVLPRLVAELNSGDFYRPVAAAAFAAITELHQHGHHVDVTTVADALRQSGKLEEIGGIPGLLDLTTGFPGVHAVGTYIAIVRREATARSVLNHIGQARHELAENVDPVEVVASLSERLSNLDRGGKLPERYWKSSKDYLAADHSDTTTPLAEGVCYPLSRIMVIASEKLGKSVLVRSIAYCLAAGIHPFDPRIRIEPVPTLLFDAENDDDELSMSMTQIRKCVEARAGEDAPWPSTYSVPYGVDLETRRDRGDLLAVLEDCRPRLIVGGPVYKMTDQTKEMSEDRRAAIVQGVFNDIRKRWGSAVILEHHAPTGGPKGRDMKAKGGQVWPAWVNMTIALHSERDGMSAEVRYPHPPRGKFRWPRRFDRGTSPREWPWIPVLRSPISATPPLATQAEPAWEEEPF
jgi:replicative DNA helicase